MPVVIDEIVISVEVTGQEAGGAASGPAAGSSDERQAIVAECVERVLDVLERKDER